MLQSQARSPCLIRLGRNAGDRLAPADHAEALERARKLAPLLAKLKSAILSARKANGARHRA